FVGGLPQNCSEDVFRDYFQTFGKIVDIVVMKDRDTGNSRGFGFVTFDSTDAVDKVIAQYKEHKIEGKWVETKRAQPRGVAPPPTRAPRSSRNDRDRGDRDRRR
ncbi:unnamed protein product, partial [Prorocentrum cordatum]